MGRQHHRLLKPLLAVLAGLFAQAAGANVIYDVKTSYWDGSYFSFSMEFADSTGTKSFADLISSGPAQDFQAENFKYSLYGLPTIYQFVDFTPTSLNFNPATGAISYASVDVFKLSTSLYITGITDQGFFPRWFRDTTNGDPCNPDLVMNLSLCSPASHQMMPSTGTTVELRAMTPVTTPVPEPSTYALMGIGLAALALSRHKAKPRG